jgi:hypothetical protein
MPATAMPTALYAASSIWTTYGPAAGLNIAVKGSTSTSAPSAIRNFVGLFIHQLTVTTKAPESAPLSVTSHRRTHGPSDARDPSRIDRHRGRSLRERRRSPRASSNERHRAGNRADGEEDGCAACPTLREVEVLSALRVKPCGFRGDHHDGHRHADHCEDDVKA